MTTCNTDTDFPGFEGYYTDMAQLPALGNDPFEHPLWLEYSKQKFLSHAQFLEEGVIQDIQMPIHYAFVYQYALLASLIMREKSSLSILDFGGGFGELYPLAVSQIEPEQISSVYYAIVDNKRQQREADLLCKSNNTIKNISHHTSIAAVQSELKGRLDICFLSGVMQYVISWKQLLKELAAMKPRYFLFTRFATSKAQTFATIQSVTVPKGYCGRTHFLIIHYAELKEIMSSLGYIPLIDNIHVPKTIEFAAQESNNWETIIAGERTLLFFKA